MSSETTKFQERVFSVVRRIPLGKVTSYGEVARAMGRPASHSRAVGGALRCNPYPKDEVPCHRVIRNDLSLGGYEGGEGSDYTNKKRNMLRKEGVVFDERNRLTEETRFHEFG